MTRSSPSVALSFVPLRVVMAVTAFLAGASFCFAANSWHKQPTFYYINQLPIPWYVYGGLLVIAAVCLCFERTRPIGYLIGAIIYTFFALASWLAVLGGFHFHIFLLSYLNFPTNSVGSFFAAGNISTIATLYWTSLRHAIQVQVDPDRFASLN